MEAISEDTQTGLEGEKQKLDHHKELRNRVLHKSLSKEETDRINSLKKNIREKTILHEKTNCKHVTCEEPRYKCLRCETCICNELDESKVTTLNV